MAPAPMRVARVSHVAVGLGSFGSYRPKLLFDAAILDTLAHPFPNVLMQLTTRDTALPTVTLAANTEFR